MVSEMPALDAVHLYRLLTGSGIELWLDGGWAVDALLGEQTRTHADLDIVLQDRDIALLRNRLAGEGYAEVQRDDSSAWNFVLQDSLGRSVDTHVVVLDDAGNGIYGPVENGEVYPAGCLNGVGMIAGCPVRCVTAEQLVLFHTGYQLRPQDNHDVWRLCARFDLPIPDEYRALFPAS
jgi:lincosamide nucleotidyltransferase A/C/D/E